MSSMVFQGIQSFFEPLVFEPCGLNYHINQSKLNQWPQIPHISEHQKFHKEDSCNQENLDPRNKKPKNNFDQKNHNSDGDTWNFIESLSNKNEKANQDEKVYVHPLAKKSSSILSLKSLEMCTESLGSETGDETSDEFSFPPSPKTYEEYPQIWKMKYEKSSKKVPAKTNFPPPLTSISGLDNVRVTPHREGGRLVLKAATVSHCNSHFHAERVDGRLRLSLVEDYYYTSNENDEIDGECEEEEEDYDNVNWVEDIAGNDEMVGCGIGIGDQPMPCRCKEKGRPNWEPCWVAIS